MDHHMHGHMEQDSYISAICVGCLRIFGSFIGVFCLAKKCSRRLLMLISGLGMFASMTSLTIIDYLKLNMTDYSSILLIISTSSFLLFHAIGLNLMPMLMIGELCPIKLKSWTSSFSIVLVAIFAFIVVKIFPIAMTTFGTVATYGFFAAVCLVGTFFSYFYVPETRGKNVEELQSMYQK